MSYLTAPWKTRGYAGSVKSGCDVGDISSAVKSISECRGVYRLAPQCDHIFHYDQLVSSITDRLRLSSLCCVTYSIKRPKPLYPVHINADTTLLLSGRCPEYGSHSCGDMYSWWHRKFSIWRRESKMLAHLPLYWLYIKPMAAGTEAGRSVRWWGEEAARRRRSEMLLVATWYDWC